MTKLTGAHNEFGILSSKIEIRYGNWGSRSQQAEMCGVRKVLTIGKEQANMYESEKEACHFELIWVAIGPSHFGHLEAYYDLRKVKFCLNACVQKIAVCSTGSTD